MSKINSIKANWILDSRGLPTVTCEVVIANSTDSFVGVASVPSGASTGSYEALELRDNGTDFGGKGVQKAVDNINQIIAPKMIGMNFANSKDLDTFLLTLDSSTNKSKLGANAILGVSMSAARAFANEQDLELYAYLRNIYFSNLSGFVAPKLMCNVVNGGSHADSGLAIQEFMIIPNTQNLESDVRASSEIYHSLKKNLKKQNYSIALGDEGGFAPHIATTPEVLNQLMNAISVSGYTDNCDLAMDCAASEFLKDGVYTVDNKQMTNIELSDFYAELVAKYPIVSIEDGFGEDDIVGFKDHTNKIGSICKIIGDDLFVTNPARFKAVGLTNGLANGVLIKLNQIGSVLETCEMINLAKENGYCTAISHRSGETIDAFISDLAFACNSEFIKLGAPARGERVAKFNRLLEISRDQK
jgi:enolase